MISDDAKVSLLDWIFGKKALDKAAQQGNSVPVMPGAKPPVPPVPPVKPSMPGEQDYVKKQIEEEMKRQKASKAAMDKLKKVK